MPDPITDAASSKAPNVSVPYSSAYGEGVDRGGVGGIEKPKKTTPQTPGHLSGGPSNYTPQDANFTPATGGAAKAPEPEKKRPQLAGGPRLMEPLPPRDISTIDVTPSPGQPGSGREPEKIKISDLEKARQQQQTYDIINVGGVSYSVKKGSRETPEQFAARIERQNKDIRAAYIRSAEAKGLGEEKESIVKTGATITATTAAAVSATPSVSTEFRKATEQEARSQLSPVLTAEQRLRLFRATPEYRAGQLVLSGQAEKEFQKLEPLEKFKYESPIINENILGDVLAGKDMSTQKRTAVYTFALDRARADLGYSTKAGLPEILQTTASYASFGLVKAPERNVLVERAARSPLVQTSTLILQGAEIGIAAEFAVPALTGALRAAGPAVPALAENAPRIAQTAVTVPLVAGLGLYSIDLSKTFSQDVPSLERAGRMSEARLTEFKAVLPIPAGFTGAVAGSRTAKSILTESRTGTVIESANIRGLKPQIIGEAEQPLELRGTANVRLPETLESRLAHEPTRVVPIDLKVKYKDIYSASTGEPGSDVLLTVKETSVSTAGKGMRTVSPAGRLTTTLAQEAGTNKFALQFGEQSASGEIMGKGVATEGITFKGQTSGFKTTLVELQGFGTAQGSPFVIRSTNLRIKELIQKPVGPRFEAPIRSLSAMERANLQYVDFVKRQRLQTRVENAAQGDVALPEFLGGPKVDQPVIRIPDAFGARKLKEPSPAPTMINMEALSNIRKEQQLAQQEFRIAEDYPEAPSRRPRLADLNKASDLLGSGLQSAARLGELARSESAGQLPKGSAPMLKVPEMKFKERADFKTSSRLEDLTRTSQLSRQNLLQEKTSMKESLRIGEVTLPAGGTLLRGAQRSTQVTEQRQELRRDFTRTGPPARQGPPLLPTPSTPVSGGGGFRSGGGSGDTPRTSIARASKDLKAFGMATPKGKATVGLLSEGFSKAIFGKSTFDKRYKGSREILSPSKELARRELSPGKILAKGGPTARRAFRRKK